MLFLQRLREVGSERNVLFFFCVDTQNIFFCLPAEHLAETKTRCTLHAPNSW